MRKCHFQVQNGSFVLKKFFLVQTIIIIFIYLLALFMLQNLQKFLQLIQSYEDVPFLDPKSSICLPKIIWKIIHIILIDLSLCKIWAQNGPFSQMRIFLENLLMSLVSFIHVYLHAKKKKKSKSDINLLVKYWLLKSHWARAIFGYNLRTRFFPSMQFLQNFNEP